MEKKDIGDLFKFAEYNTGLEYDVADELCEIYNSNGEELWRGEISDRCIWLEQFWKKYDGEGMMIDIEKEDLNCLYKIVVNYFELLYVPEWIKVKGKVLKKQYLEKKMWLEYLNDKYELKVKIDSWYLFDCNYFLYGFWVLLRRFVCFLIYGFCCLVYGIRKFNKDKNVEEDIYESVEK